MKSARMFIILLIIVVGSTGVAYTSSSVLASHGPPMLATTGSTTNTWWVGASSTDSSALPNTGVRGDIQVVSTAVSGTLAFWVSDALSNNMWGQVGYYLFHGSAPVAFYQVWNLNTYSVISTGTTAVDLGNHTFAMFLQGGTTWAYSLDGTVFGTYNMGSSVASSSYPVYAISEEGYVSLTVQFPHDDLRHRAASASLGLLELRSNLRFIRNGMGRTGQLAEPQPAERRDVSGLGRAVNSSGDNPVERRPGIFYKSGFDFFHHDGIHFFQYFPDTEYHFHQPSHHPRDRDPHNPDEYVFECAAHTHHFDHISVDWFHSQRYGDREDQLFGQ